MAAKELPHPHLLKASDKLLNCRDVRSTFFDYPGDDGEPKCLDGLVLERLAFEQQPPHRLQVCKECLGDLSKERIPEAALANGLWLGDLPERLRDATFVELLAASPVRVSGMVLALDELKVGNVAGSAKPVMRGTFTFYMQDAYGVQQRLPACDTDLAGSFTIALVGARPTHAQLRRLLGARRDMVLALLEYLLDKDNRLVGEHKLARQAIMSPENLDRYSDDGAVPQAILDAMISVKDPTGSYADARSTHAHGNRETETPLNTEGGGAVVDDDGSPLPPFIINTNAVVDTGDDGAVASSTMPRRLRRLGATLADGEPSLAQETAAEAAVRAGRPSPIGTDKALVLTHSGKFVSDFYDPGLFAAAFFTLFPHGVGGHLDDRPRFLPLKKWAQILLRRRDPRFRKHRTFLFCVCALIFRREAMANTHFKLSGRVSPQLASLLSSITPEDLSTAAAEMEGRASRASTLRDREGIRTLINMMESVHAGASWTIHNKRATRMIAISYIVQMGQPLIW